MTNAIGQDDAILRVVLEALLDGVAACDASGRIFFVNKAMVRLMGFEDTDNAPELTLPEIMSRLEAYRDGGAALSLSERPLMRALRGETVVDMPLTLRLPRQNRVIEVINSALPVFADDGSVRMAVIRIRDVTEQRRALRELKHSEDRYQLALRAIDAMLYDWDLTTGYVSRSEALELVLGFKPEESEPRASWWRNRIHPDDVAALSAEVETHLATSQERHFAEYRIRHRDGRWITVADRSIALFDAKGRPTRVVGSVVDVTERRQGERARAESEQRYRTLFENASDIVATLDLDFRITSINAAVERILGYSPEEVIGTLLADYIAPEQDQRAPAGAYEVLMRAKGGLRTVALEVRASILADARGKPVALHAIARDVTDRKHAEARQLILMRELQHRTKNILAVVQSLVTNTLRSATSLAQANDSLIGRLHAVASAQEFVTAEGVGGAPLSTLVEGELAAFAGRVRAEGPALIVGHGFAQTFTLVVHELATNAAKYGALSVPDGQVDVTWQVVVSAGGAQEFRFSWRERGGPPVTVPRSAGFGRKIINLLGQPTLQFLPEGLCYQVSVPMSDLAP